MRFQFVNDSMEIYECEIEVSDGKNVKRSIARAPRMMLEQEFLSLAQKASQSQTPVKVRMSHKVPIYIDFEKRWVTREFDVSVKNRAYMDMESRQTDKNEL